MGASVIPIDSRWDDLPPDFDATIADLPIPTNGNRPLMASTMRLLDDVEVMKLPPPEWIVDGVLERRSKAAIIGQSGTFKTTELSYLLVCVATGKEWRGHRVMTPGKSIYVAAESGGFPQRLAASKRACGLSLTEAIGVYTYQAGIDLRNRLSVDNFVTFVLSHELEPEIIAIDTYAAATPGAAENTSEDTTVAMAAADCIRRGVNATVILVHHTNAAGTRERGHSSMRGDLDTLIWLEEVHPDIEVKCDKQRNAAHFETIKLRPVPEAGGGVVLRSAAQMVPSSDLTDKQLATLGVLREAGRDGLTKVQWKDAVKNIATERSFYKIAKRLDDLGHLTQNGNYMRAKVTE